MKPYASIVILSLLLFSSCIVKSIQPFYTNASIEFDDAVIGTWKDHKKQDWKFTAFKTLWENENKGVTQLSREDLEAFTRYKNGYVVEYKRNNNKATFIGMPFKINGQLLIDFTPLEFESEDLNPLIAQHLLKTHSAVLVEVKNTKQIKLKWISEKAMNNLIENNKLRLKHEKTGIDKDLVLTASSEELHGFLEKFISSDSEEMWDNDDIFTLNLVETKP